MSRSTRVQLIVLAVLAVLLATPFLIPLNVYRGSIEAAASRALSREVHVRGPVHLSLYPTIGLSLSDVSIANLPGARDPEMMRAAEVVVGARIAPLFSGRLEVTELTLQEPSIHLERTRQAGPNWTFGRDPSGRPADAGRLNRIGFSHININNGAVSYYDAASGKSANFTDVTLSLDMPDRATPTLARPLTLNGGLTYNGENLKINTRLDNFGALLNARTTGARISIGSNVINAEFTGTLGAEGSLSGALKLGAHSVRSFAAWLGHPLPPGNGFGLVALEGQFNARDGVYALSHTHLGFDSMNVNGDIALDTNPDVLALKGHLTIDRININPYLAPGTNQDAIDAAKARAASRDAPFSLSGLKAMNADLTLMIGGLALPHLKLDQAVVKAALNDGVLKADLSSITAYGGKGEGSLTVDARGAEPAFRQTLEISGMKAQPFLTELAGITRISGTGAVKFDIASRGDHSLAIVRGLNGKGEIRLADGAISGADLAAVARVVQTLVSGEVPGNVSGAGAKTPFARLGADFTLKDGVLHSDDVQLVHRAVQMTGRGDVDFAARTLEFHFQPKPVKPIPGLPIADIGVPFYVKGPWEKPSYGPDVRGLAKSIAEKLQRGATSPLELLTQPGLSLKSFLGSEKRPPN